MDIQQRTDEFTNYQITRQNFWDDVAISLDTWKGWGGYYHRRLSEILKHIIPENKKILELGCGDGKLLASLAPSFGVGIDFSSEMCNRASSLYPKLNFVVADAHFIPIEESFDYIIISDLLNDLWDVQHLFGLVKSYCQKNTRIIINVYSRLWEIPLAIGQAAKVAKPNLPQNWLSPLDITRLLELENFEVIKKTQEILFPFYIPLLTPFLNRFIGRFWPFRHFSLSNVIIARLGEKFSISEDLPTVSVIIPARNEAGNIEALFTRTPELGSGTELIFVEGHSKDNTHETINKFLDQYPERNAKLFKQPGKGKGDAVRLGFKEATGDILMILDSDLSVPPEDLTLFYNALIENKGDFINGVRLVYPMEDQAMRFLNLIGNQFFSKTFSWLLNQPIKDTLCGTKVLFNEDYLQILRNRSYFGDFDPFGDFDLLFGAAKLNLKIVDIPIRYKQRVYGQTNIHRFRHGLLLLKMTFIASVKLKFI